MATPKPKSHGDLTSAIAIFLTVTTESRRRDRELYRTAGQQGSGTYVTARRSLRDDWVRERPDPLDFSLTGLARFKQVDRLAEDADAAWRPG